MSYQRIVLSNTGGDRATAYAMSAKVARIGSIPVSNAHLPAQWPPGLHCFIPAD